jgi:DNA-binding GntR family transcriptional regulator
LQDRVYRVLLQALHDGRFAPGQLVNESAVAKDLKTSRSPVREAVMRLTQEGHFGKAPNGRYFVVPLTDSDVCGLYDVRACLEGLAGYLASKRISDEDVEVFEQIVRQEKVSATRGDSAGLLAAGDAFHGKLVELANNPFLTEAINTLRSRVRPYSLRSTSLPSRKTHVIEEHAEIVKALRRRDADAVKHLMERHIENSRERILEARQPLAKEA